MSLILLRHTRPDVAEGVCYGRTDLPPADDFETAASAVIAGLPDVSRVVTSPLVRCARLAERIAAARDLDPETDPRIVEMDFGSWERTAWNAIPRDELDAWAADFHRARPHGGESVAMLAARVGAALDETMATDPPILWVTHAGVVRAACAARAVERGWETRLDFGRWLVLPATGRDPSRTAPSRYR